MHSFMCQVSFDTANSVSRAHGLTKQRQSSLLNVYLILKSEHNDIDFLREL